MKILRDVYEDSHVMLLFARRSAPAAGSPLPPPPSFLLRSTPARHREGQLGYEGAQAAAWTNTYTKGRGSRYANS